MSNVELLIKFYSLFKAGDKQGCLALYDDALEWNAMEGMPAGGRYAGKEAVFDQYFPKILANFAEFHASVKEYLDAGDSVVVPGKYSGESKAGKEFTATFAHVNVIKNGRIASFRQYIPIVPLSSKHWPTAERLYYEELKYYYCTVIPSGLHGVSLFPKTAVDLEGLLSRCIFQVI